MKKIPRKLKLNVTKIEAELNRLGKNYQWVADELNCTRAHVSDILRRKPITKAETFAHILKIDPKDLII